MIDTLLAQAAHHLVALAILPSRQSRRGVQFESKHARDVPRDGFFGNESRVGGVKQVLESGAEVGAVDVGVAGGFGVVDVFAFAAVEFHGLYAGHVGHAGGEEGLEVAVDAGAFAKFGFFVFLDLGWGDRLLARITFGGRDDVEIRFDFKSKT